MQLCFKSHVSSVFVMKIEGAGQCDPSSVVRGSSEEPSNDKFDR